MVYKSEHRSRNEDEEYSDYDEPRTEFKSETAKKLGALEYDEREKLTVDDAFAIYLNDVSKMVNKNFYKKVLRFIFLYRDCLNEWGWMKRRDNYMKAEMTNDDELVERLKAEEEEKQGVSPKKEQRQVSEQQ